VQYKPRELFLVIRLQSFLLSNIYANLIIAHFSIHHIYLECQADPLTPLFFVRGLLMQYFAINLIVCAAFFAHIAHYWPMKPEAFCCVCKCKAQNVGPLELTMLGLCDK
jgi:hypothetical protein